MHPRPSHTPSTGWDLEVQVLGAQWVREGEGWEGGEEPLQLLHQGSLITTTGSLWDSRATRVSRPQRDQKSEVGGLESSINSNYYFFVSDFN